jgi:fructuronate reductase
VRLSERTLARLPGTVARFGYDRAAQASGIVHLGVGAFHRAHQAWYTDRAMDAGDRDWMIAGVSLRSGEVAAQLNPQDGLYTMAERSAHGVNHRVVGSVREVMVAGQSRARLAIDLIAPTTRIASFSITEKGYCRAADGSLDFAEADAGSIYPILADAFRQRKAAGIEGLTLLSCDNLAGNGAQLARLMGEYLDRHDPALRAWFEAVCTCPSTMVDRIVPATTDVDRAAATEVIGLEDAAAVVTEPFSQWVIEDRFAGPRPRWEVVGAELASDVRPYETAKLRMLNGAHSALAYLGLQRGHRFVHEAVADPAIRPLVIALMRDAADSLIPAPGQDLAAYTDALLVRFANAALPHRLAQIAMDGSQKLPQRWLGTLAHHQRRGRRCPAILAGIAAWLRHVRGDNGPVDDPLASPLRAAWAAAGEAGIVGMAFGKDGLLASDWRPGAEEQAAIAAALG